MAKPRFDDLLEVVLSKKPSKEKLKKQRNPELGLYLKANILTCWKE